MTAAYDFDLWDQAKLNAADLIERAWELYEERIAYVKANLEEAQAAFYAVSEPAWYDYRAAVTEAEAMVEQTWQSCWEAEQERSRAHQSFVMALLTTAATGSEADVKAMLEAKIAEDA